MPAKFTYSLSAERDVRTIYLDTAKEWGIAQADKYDAGLEQSVHLLAENPDLGRRCDEIRTGYQRHEHDRHVIFYRKRKTDALIIRILHDRMDVKGVLVKK